MRKHKYQQEKHSVDNASENPTRFHSVQIKAMARTVKKESGCSSAVKNSARYLPNQRQRSQNYSTVATPIRSNGVPNLPVARAVNKFSRLSSTGKFPVRSVANQRQQFQKCKKIIAPMRSPHGPYIPVARASNGKPGRVSAIKNLPSSEKQLYKKHDVDDTLAASMKSLSLDTNKLQFAKEVKKIGIASCVHKYITTWIKQVFAKVGPDKNERSYHLELKELLLALGFDVAYEHPLKYDRKGMKDKISKRVDLIVSMPYVIEKVLIECKAKKKVGLKDYKQLFDYQYHYGISECWLVNFYNDSEVWHLGAKRMR